MNKRALQKCIDELNGDKPRIDYVKGILETLIESLVPNEPIAYNAPISLKEAASLTPVFELPTDEAARFDMETKARLQKIDKSAIQIND